MLLGRLQAKHFWPQDMQDAYFRVGMSTGDAKCSSLITLCSSRPGKNHANCAKPATAQ